MSNWYESFKNSWPLRQLGLAVEESAEIAGEKKPGYQFTAVLAPWESYMVTLQSLLIWEKPLRSLFALAFFNILFWFCIWSEPKPYFVLSSVGLAVFLHQQWVHTIWPEIRVPLKPGERPAHYTDEWLYLNPSVLSAPEVGLLLDQWCSSARSAFHTCIQTRRHKPTLFCVCSCGVFTALLFTGQLLSGTALLYSCLTALILLPGTKIYVFPVIKCRSRNLLEWFRHKYWDKLAIGTSSHGSRESSPDELSEFLPELGSAEAEAALAVPLTKDDPPEAAAVSTHRHVAVTRAHYDDDSNDPHLRAPSEAPMLSQDSPYGSLAPHIPTHSQIPGVSDSSDEDEQEFMEGLVFDGRQAAPPLHASYPPPSHRRAPDYTDSSLHNPAPYVTDVNSASESAIQGFKSSLMQFSQVGSESAGALFSSLGQSMLMSVVNNMNQVAQAAQTSDNQRGYEELSDEYSGPDAPERASERRVRRRPNRHAHAAHQAKEAALSEQGTPTGDFVYISDEEFSE
ncbi:reticulophagy regulator 1 [Hyalella azteca]|uniref:Reticulophagy regulator 1 n=1 Tax=Hyalella azteca TaxID=294128 RepID=A0A8B7N8V1_HYAAZ|nr:reticulophagy regulator 1 [Hyalella azteca]